MKLFSSTLLGLFSLFALPLTGWAQLNIYLGDVLAGQTVSVVATGISTLDTVDLGGSFGNESAARIDISVTHKNSANQTVTTANVPTFCTDLYDGISLNTTYTYKVIKGTADQFPLNDENSSKVNASRLLALGYLYKKAFGSVQNYLTLIPTWSTSNITGFQAAIWEIVHDDWKDGSNNYGFSLLNGNITNLTNTASVSFAESLLAQTRVAIANNEPRPMGIAVFTNGTVQDLLLPFEPIPEPSTYALVGAGSLLGLAALRRRRRAVKQAA